MLLLPIAAVSLAVAGISMGIRSASDDLTKWHQYPSSVSMPDRPNWYRLTPGTATDEVSADREGESPQFDVSVRELATAFDNVAMGDSRVEVLAGSARKGFVTYIQRSKLMSYPDYVSVRFTSRADGGSTLAILSRARYGSNDLGANKKRVDRWVQQTQEMLDAAGAPATARSGNTQANP